MARQRLPFSTHLLHNHILAFTQKLILSFDNSLEKFQILDMTTMRLYTVYKMLYNFIVDFVTKRIIILENTTNGFSFSDLKICQTLPPREYCCIWKCYRGYETYSWVQKQI